MYFETFVATYLEGIPRCVRRVVFFLQFGFFLMFFIMYRSFFCYNCNGYIHCNSSSLKSVRDIFNSLFKASAAVDFVSLKIKIRAPF